MKTFDVIEKVRFELRESSDENTKKSSQYFFKESIKCYGVKSALVGKISKENFQLVKELEKSQLFNFCEEFWKSEIIEETFIACNWSYMMHKKFEADDLILFEKWVSNYITNWASCDTFCNHTLGEYFEMFPEKLFVLKGWALSPNRWMKRAAAVSLIIPAKRGLFLNDIFEICDILLTDKDDMVQKGYGWLLKSADHSHRDEVFDYVLKNKQIMPRTSLRYAIEKMPGEMKALAMEK